MGMSLFLVSFSIPWWIYNKKACTVVSEMNVDVMIRKKGFHWKHFIFLFVCKVNSGGPTTADIIAKKSDS